MKLELNCKLGILIFFAFITLMPKISVGQNNLHAGEVNSDSMATCSNMESVPGSSLLPPEKTEAKGNSINYWGTAGGTLIGKFGEINIDVNKNLFSVHYLEYKKFNGLDIDFSYTYSKPDPEYKELGLLYGRILTDSNRRLYISISAGISRIVVKDWEIVLVEERDSWLSGPYTYVEYGGYEYMITGYPLKCKIMYRGKHLGIGLDLIANMSQDSYLTACVLHLSFGKLK